MKSHLNKLGSVPSDIGWFSGMNFDNVIRLVVVRVESYTRDIVTRDTVTRDTVTRWHD